MKTNAQQIEAIATLIKPFDAIQTAHFLAREIVGYNKSSDTLENLQKQIDDAKVDKGTRKKAIDTLLKDLWQNNIKMIKGKGVSKCPIRIALREVLSKESLADTTINNILTAVSFALEHKKPYDIKAPDKYNAMLKAEKEKEKLKAEILKGATTPSATTPSATTSSATTSSATTSSATTSSAKKNTRLDYCKDASAVMRQLFDATQFRKCLNDSDSAYYDEIIENIKNITTILATMAKDKDYMPNMGDMDDMQDDDIFDGDNLNIDTEMVD